MHLLLVPRTSVAFLILQVDHTHTCDPRASTKQLLYPKKNSIDVYKTYFASLWESVFKEVQQKGGLYKGVNEQGGLELKQGGKGRANM